MKIGGIQKISMIDYPGKMSCVLFTSGCNFKCPYCHNPELIHTKKELNLEEIFLFLKTRIDFIEGIVISGGEPTLHTDLLQFCKKIKKMGFKIKLDTNGSNPNMIGHVIDFVDYIAMDIKTLPKNYKRLWINAKYKNILNSINLIKKYAKDYEFRTTLVKPFITFDNIEKIGEIIENANLYALQKYKIEKVLNKKFFENKNRSFTDYEIQNLKLKISFYVKNVVVR